MTQPATQVVIDVISPVPEGWGFCISCEMIMAQADMDKPPYERNLEEYPPDWQEDFRRLSDTVMNIAARYGDGVLIRIFDPRSLQGLWKSVRYGVRRYPTFIVLGHGRVVGADIEQMDEILQTAGLVPQFANITP